MAQIKMDISEYEEMKKNTKLLEQSLEKERDLKLQVDKLTEEKIKALEDAKMKVVKVTKTEHTEHLQVVQTGFEYTSHQQEELIYRVFRALGVDISRGIRGLPRDIDLGALADSLFKKVTTKSTPINETVIEGFDEVKKEIREEYEAKKTQEEKDILEKAKGLEKKVSDLEVENEKYRSNERTLFKRLEKEKKDNESLRDHLDKEYSKNSKAKKLIRSVEEVVKSEWSWMNAHKKKKEIIENLKTFDNDKE